MSTSKYAAIRPINLLVLPAHNRCRLNGSLQHLASAVREIDTAVDRTPSQGFFTSASNPRPYASELIVFLLAASEVHPSKGGKHDGDEQQDAN